MKRAVVWTDGALLELLAISRYTAADRPSAAAAVVAKLRVTATHLGDTATGRSGRVTNTYEKVVPGLPYILVYEIVSRPEGELIAILHVIHGARDWPAGGWPDD